MGRLLVVALLAQSLVIFEATEGSFSNATTKVWPSGIQLLDTIMVLALHVVLMLFALSNPPFESPCSLQWYLFDRSPRLKTPKLCFSRFS
jgi:hypothetical protein